MGPSRSSRTRASATVVPLASARGGDSDAGSPPPVVGAMGASEHEVQGLLKFNFNMRYGRPYVLVL